VTRVLIVILIIIAIGYLWYQMQARKAAEEERKAKRQVSAGGASVRPLPPAAAAPVIPPVPAAPPAAAVVAEPARDSSKLQEAADAAAGIGLDEQTEKMEDLTAGLAAARREAEAAAARLAVEADAALDEVRAAGQVDADEEVVVEEASTGGVPGQIIDVEATILSDRAERRRDIVAQAIAAADADSVPPGAIRGDGGSICPPVYPIKGNAQTMLYHLPNNPTYASTIPELCFSNVEAAIAAGYQEARH
jgi:type IV secretory pathway VirB10-like protein